MSSRPRALVFDVFGTLVDWYSSIKQLAERVAADSGATLDGGALALGWRGRYLPSMQRVQSGERPWCNLDQLHRESLNEVLAELGVDLPPKAREELVAGWHNLRPWDEVRDALPRFKADFITASLSNGHMRLLVDLSRHAELEFDAILSAELAQTYKPDPEVYLTAARLLDLRPEEVMLIACHAWDLDGAAAAGLRTGYVSRAAEWGPDAPPRPVPSAELTATDLHDLADQLTTRH